MRDSIFGPQMNADERRSAFICVHLRPVFFFLVASTALAAVDGTVVNRTSGKPQVGASVTFVNIGASGMEPAGTVKTDAQGKFHFDQNPQGPALIQVEHEGVTYNHQMMPGGAAGPVEIAIYDVSKQPGAAKIAQHMLVLEPAGEQLNVTESFFFANDGNLTYNDPAGTLRFFVPEGASDPNVNATAPQGMPLARSADKTREAGVFAVDFPIKPGETRFDITYTMPFKAPGPFASRVLYKDVVTRAAAPSGVQLSGEGVKQIGEEPTSHAAVYEVAGADFRFNIEGSGALRRAAAQPAGDEDSGPQIQQILPRVYDRVAWILAAALIALAAGFVILYRSGRTAAKPRA